MSDNNAEKKKQPHVWHGRRNFLKGLGYDSQQQVRETLAELDIRQKEADTWSPTTTS